MPRSEPIVGLPGFETIDVAGTLEVITTGKLTDDATCPDCRSTGPHRRKDLVTRKVRHKHRCQGALVGRSCAQVALLLWSVFSAAHARRVAVPASYREVQRTASTRARAGADARAQDLGQTLWSWREPIAQMWRFTKTNGITEGLHNKMEVISRRAYGFRNFQNYRLRVRALCG